MKELELDWKISYTPPPPAPPQPPATVGNERRHAGGSVPRASEPSKAAVLAPGKYVTM